MNKWEILKARLNDELAHNEIIRKGARNQADVAYHNGAHETLHIILRWVEALENVERNTKPY